MIGRFSASLREFLFRADAGKRNDWETLRSSGLFDEDWYLDRYPDAGTSGFDPLIHYLEFGEAEGRSPNPVFDVAWYRSRTADLDQSDSSLVHFARVGLEARIPAASAVLDLALSRTDSWLGGAAGGAFRLARRGC